MYPISALLNTQPQLLSSSLLVPEPRDVITDKGEGGREQQQRTWREPRSWLLGRIGANVLVGLASNRRRPAAHHCLSNILDLGHAYTTVPFQSLLPIPA